MVNTAKQRYQPPPFNPVCHCFCCGQDIDMSPWGKPSYEERVKFAFVPRRDGQRYWCDNCEKQQCPNMPGVNHHRTYRYIPLHRGSDKPVDAELMPIATVINTVGTHRESLTPR